MRPAMLFAFAALLCSIQSPSHAAGPFRQWLAERQGEASESDVVASRDISLSPGAVVMRDVAYGSDSRQVLDVYLPANAKDAPVLFMVHGGAWRFGDKAAAGVVQNKITRWLPKGFIFVSIDYPMLPEHDALAQADDVARALAFAQARASSWGGDPTKFIVIGHSAGAHLVALLAADPARAYLFGAKPWLGTVSLDSAALDVAQIMDNRHLPFYDAAFGGDHQRWRLASPIDALTSPAAPILAVCSLLRRDHSCDRSTEFVAEANRLGVRARVSRQMLSHEEINKSLGLPGAYTDDVESFMASLDPSVSAMLDRRAPVSAH